MKNSGRLGRSRHLCCQDVVCLTYAVHPVSALNTFECGPIDVSLILVFREQMKFSLAFCLLWIACAEGGCRYESRTYQPGESWRSENCQYYCTCEDSSVSCDLLLCNDPGCNFTAGEFFVFIENDPCCPVCDSTPGNCQYQGQYYLEGTKWKTSSCESCHCSSGIVSCTSSKCSPLHCSEDDVPLQPRDECCPRCLPYRKTCLVDGVVYEDGERWTSNQCMLCQCEDGRHVCYISVCPPLVCAQDEILKTASEDCCPQCVKFQCEHSGIKYQDGDYWWPDSCTSCYCTNASVVCQIQQCLSLGQCPEGHELIQRTGHCCPTCALVKSLCYVNDEIYFDGEIWKSTDCSTCVCRGGQIFCQKVSCSSEPCKLGESRIQKLGECCPVCSLTRSCNFNGTTYEHDTAWEKDECTLCNCKDGKVTCFAKMCSCQEDLGTPDSGQCCLACDTGSCDSLCKKCMDTDPSYCLECLETHHVLHHGKCLFDCERGYFVNEMKQCQLCHPSCGKCFGELPSQCLSCPKGLFLKKGYCVEDCGYDFFEDNDKCIACHSSCSKCVGPTEDQCLECTLRGQLLQNGRCTDYCTGHFYISDGNCFACNATCQRCLKDGSCQFCPEDLYLENGLCMEECTPGHYAYRDAYCLPCHEMCLFCFGPMPFQCTICPFGLYLLQGFCVSDCGQGYYRDQGGGVCTECHSDCHLCLGGPANNQCLSCAKGHLLPHKGTSFGRCVTECPPKYYLTEDGRCEECHESCKSCFGSNDTDCLSCENSFYLKNNKCVQHCSAGFFVEPENNTCSACHPACSVCNVWGANKCLSCHPGDVLESGRCGTICRMENFSDSDETCKLCHSSCETCMVNLTSNDSLCVQCKNQHHYISGERCVEICGQNFYLNSYGGCEECPIKCASCTRGGADGCTTCWDGNFLTDDGTCVPVCHQGHFGKNGVCEACDPNCFRCSEHGHCEHCMGKYVLQYGKCVSECSERHYVDLSTAQCTECSPECLTCIGPSSEDCLSCVSGKLLQNGACVESCIGGYYEEEEDCILCDLKCKTCSDFDKCTSCEHPLLLLDGECVSDCGSGKYADLGSSTCLSCPEHCTYCLASEECELCDVGFYVYNSRCVRSCPRNHYSDLLWRFCEGNVHAPQLIMNNTLTLGVGNTVPINITILSVADQETDLANIKFIVVEKPQNGALIRKSDDGGEIILDEKHSFTVLDLMDGWIFFKHFRKVPLSGHLVLKASDRQLESPGVVIPIQIISHDPPVVKQKQPLIAYSNTTTVISSDSLQVFDRDNLEDVTLQIIQGPHQGILTYVGQDEKITTFTALDLLNHKIEYKHLDSQKRNKDAVIFRATDGYNFEFVIYTVFIIPENIAEPVVVLNKPVYVKAGEDVKITSENLYAVDRGSDPSHIHFSLQGGSSQTMGGFLSKSNGKILKERIKKFTQHDLNRNRISYHHENTEILNGTMKLKVTSSKDPIRNFDMVDFHIHVLTSNFTPEPEAPSNLGMMVLENQEATLSSSHLPATMNGMDAKDLLYEITENLKQDEGMLAHVHYPDVALTSFTQADVEDSKIVYKPPSKTVPKEQFDFHFIVKDAASGFQLQPVQRFTFSIIPMNNSPSLGTPHSHESTVVVEQGGSVALYWNIFSTVGHEVPDEQLEVMLTKAPSHGVLIQGTGPDEMELEEDEGLSFTSLRSNFFYKNDGSENWRDEAVFTITSGRHTSSNLLNIEIKKRSPAISIDTESPEILDISTLMGSVTEGEFFVIERKNLGYTDLVSADSDITFMLLSELKYGNLEKFIRGRYTALKQKDSFSQVDINESLMRYRAKDDIGRKTEYIYLNVTDGSGNVRPNQVFTIKIKQKTRIAPVLTVLEDIQVDEGGEVIFGSSIIDIFDPDSHTADLRVFVEEQPIYGSVVNSRPNPGAEVPFLRLSVDSFPYVDLLEGFISYRQDVSFVLEPTWDFFKIRVSDGRLSSSTVQVNVTIRPTNDEAPFITTEPLYVTKGGIVKITNATFSVADVDSGPANLVITLESIPMNGEILRVIKSAPPKKPVEILQQNDHFTFQDVLDELIAYSHHKSQGMFNDSIHVSVSDGLFQDSGDLVIIVVDSDKEAPYLDINRGLELEAGTEAIITRAILHATDIDSDVNLLTYEITADSSSGRLVLLGEGGLSSVLSLKGPFVTFNQNDINLGNLKYVHNSNDPVGVHSFKFNVKDPAGNSLLDQRFIITIKDDVLPPNIARNTGLRVAEGSSEAITTDHLYVNDTDSGQERLVFHVTSGPTLGHLEQRAAKGIHIIQFTWGDLISQNVLYAHTSEAEDYFDSFLFNVTDGKNFAVQTFHITILPVDDSLPHVIVKPLRLSEGSFKVITPFELKVLDLDTKDSLLRVTVTTLPSYGLLIRGITDGKNLSATSFSMVDIHQGKISYHHDGSDTLEDFFEFTISDGTNPQFVLVNGNNVTTRESVVFPITIFPVDDSVPVLTVNTDLKHLIFSQGQYWNGITKNVLHAEDADTDPVWILYTVTQQPVFGILELVSHPGKMQMSFTQGDINQNSLRYVLVHDDLSSTEDSFVFSLQDTGRNILRNNMFRISWSRVNFTLLTHNASETVGSVKIGVSRHGNTYKNSFVHCEVQKARGIKSADEDDFDLVHSEVAFEGRDREKFCILRIHDDLVCEGQEAFILQLSNPSYALLGTPSAIQISIHDDEDEPLIGFRNNVYRVNETQNTLAVPVYRTGDTSKFTSVLCSTQSITAKGSGPSGLETGSDYRSRFVTDLSELEFAPGVSETTCNVMIIDDSFYEEEEEFELILSNPSPRAKLGTISRVGIVINGPNDVPVVYIASTAYEFKESSGEVKLDIVRSGPDLNQPCKVWCNTGSSPILPALEGQDFLKASTEIVFGSGQQYAECPIVILDDSPRDKVEGEENFVVFLNNPVGCVLGKPSSATITIQDEESDVPQIQFGSTFLEVQETDGEIRVPVMRSGDLSLSSSVRCITRQDSATVDEDFLERVDTDESLVTFLPDEAESICHVEIIDDTKFEGKEYFLLKLIPAKKYEANNIKIGSRDSIAIEITDPEDAAVIELESVYYDIEVTKLLSENIKVSVGVLRKGDLSQHSRVRISTQDGSALSGADYHAVSRQLDFQTGEKKKELEVEVLYNPRRRWSLFFTVSLSQDDLVNAELGNNTKATVTITDSQPSGSSIFPSIPLVVSLLHYDDMEKGLKTNPPAGYPLICVTPCDPKYPDYETTESLCSSLELNTSSLFFSWELAMATDADGSMTHFELITDSTPFTSTHNQVLDSIYFRRNVWVRCTVRPVDSNGIMGIPLQSKEVKISSTNGICHTPIIRDHHDSNLQSQNFVASLNYVKSTDKETNNRIHIRVQIPHQDGMLPLISTYPLFNIRHLLTQILYRHQHACSNLQLGSARGKAYANKGFLSEKGAEDHAGTLTAHLPFQFDSSLRENNTLTLYRHLNLKNCTWTFDAWYHMTELVDVCGGTVTSDFMTRDGGQTFVTVQLPLYVSYVFAAAPSEWISLEHKTELQCSFLYSTVLWKAGLQTEDTLKGVLQVSRLGINRNGQLFFEFKTEAKFRGLFVVSHHTLPGIKSRVIPPKELNVHYHLELLWSERTFDGPNQLWKATSNYNLKDYSGLYVVELIPCRVSTVQMYAHFVNSSSVPCTAYNPQRFEIPLAFQQTNHPVPLTYSLNTVFQLLNNEKLFLLDPFEKNEDVQHMDYKGAFSLGDVVYGKVFWSPEQDLKSAYELRVNKVLICTAVSGYTLAYDPVGEIYGEGPQYGCIQPSKFIKHRFIILDRNNPDAEDKSFYDIPFEAKSLDSLLQSQVMSPGTDGFAFKVDALYKVNSGHQWFLQVMYTIGPSSRRFRRSLQSSLSNDLSNDDLTSDVEVLSLLNRKIQSSMNGTNIRVIRLDFAGPRSSHHHSPAEQKSLNQDQYSAVLLVTLTILVTTIVVLILVMVYFKIKILLRRAHYANQNARNSKTDALSQNKQMYYTVEAKNSILIAGHRDVRHSYCPETFADSKYPKPNCISRETEV